MATFVINGQERKLTMRDDNGIDWSDEFIGGYVHGMDKDDDGRYIATQAEYDWWQKAIADQQEMAELVAEYKRRYGADEVERWLQTTAAYDVDLEDQLSSVRLALADLDD